MTNTTIEPLRPIDMWEAGQALLDTHDRKISGRFELEWGGGHAQVKGTAIPSKDGKLCFGPTNDPKRVIQLDAAPGRGTNLAFTLRGLSTNSEGKEYQPIEGLRLRATAPVSWEIQKAVRTTDRPGAAIWTPGMKTRNLDYFFGFNEQGGARLLTIYSNNEKLCHWMLGYDAKRRPVCVIFGFKADESALFAAVDGKPLATPSEAEIAALRAEPHRLAISEADLGALGAAIRKHKPRTAKEGSDIPDWKRVTSFSDKITLDVAANILGVVPSVKGELCLGNFGKPGDAVRIKAGGADNMAFRLRIDRGPGLISEAAQGLRLSDKAPLRWEIQAELDAGPVFKGHKADHEARIGLWSPGLDKNDDYQFGGHEAPSDRRGAMGWYVKADRPLRWLLAYDADHQPAAIAVCSWTAAEYFDRGRTAVREGGLASAQKTVRQAAKAAKAREDADDAAEDAESGYPLAPATVEELRAIASAIAAGPPNKRATKINKRFSLHWEKTPIPTVKGKLAVGDPNGASFPLAAGADGPKQLFVFDDATDEDAGAWERVIYGVRLGDGPVVTWKPSMGLGVDSGRYGIWSPGFPLDDEVDIGLHEEGALVAKIIQTSQGDCSFPSLLGVDARKKPVAFLFGEGIRTEVWKLAHRSI